MHIRVVDQDSVDTTQHMNITRNFLTSFVEISEKMKSVAEPLLSVSAAAGKSFIGVENKLDDEGA